VVLFRPADDPAAQADPSSYRVRRYHHVFRGSYHSPPTDEETLRVTSAEILGDGRTVRLVTREPLIPDRIYEVRTTLDGARPAVGHYTMTRVPARPR
jgi:hypothetical protein